MMKKYDAIIGIDWGHTSHAVCLIELNNPTPQMKQLENTPEVLHQWIQPLQIRFKNQQIAVACEQSRGALIHALMAYDFIDLYPINPLTSAQFRKAFAPSGAKDDPSDARRLAQLLSQHQDKLRCWKPDEPATRKIALLCEARRKTVDMRTRVCLMLKSLLKGYFPQVFPLLGDELFAAISIDFLMKWPSLKHARCASKKSLLAFYYAHNSRSSDKMNKRLEVLEKATPLTEDTAIVESSILGTQQLCKQLRSLNACVKKYDEEIKEVYRSHEDAFIYESLPGAGYCLAPRLLSVMGTQRERWQSADDLQRFTGIAPVIERSGKKCWTHFRWRAPRFIRQSFHEFARCSIGQSKWAKAYYDMQKELGKTHQAAIRSLAYKWIRIIYKCWKERIPYDEKLYLQALERRGSPLIQVMTEGC